MTREEFAIRFCALRKSLIEMYFGGLNEKQREAVCLTEGPLLVLAGAGSGKTTVLINRIVNLLTFGSAYESEDIPPDATEDDLRFLTMCFANFEDMSAEDKAKMRRLCAVNAVKPWQIIAITFTNKAAGELRERLSTAIGEAANDVWACTFHSACMRILRRDIEKLGYSKNFTVYDEDDKRKVLSEIIKDMGLDEKYYEPRVISSTISRCKDALQTPEDYMNQAGYDQYKHKIADIFFEYQKRLKTASALDFDDIIVKTVELLQSFPEVMQYYQDKFKYVLIDEYQDTNHAQYMLSRLLTGECENIFAVGDDDQGIYKFRGASIENILQFEKNYKNARVIRLEQNYRSTENILNAANSVIAHNIGRKGKHLWTQNGKGDKVEFYHASTGEDEAFHIAATILEQYGAGANLADFAVLYRNNVLSNAIETAFKRNGIPYRVIRGKSFFERAEVKDMLAYLWLISNPDDDLRLLRIINNPARKIGLKTLDAIRELAQNEGVSMFKIIETASGREELSRAAAPLMSFAEMIKNLKQLSVSMNLPDFYNCVVEQTGYGEMLLRKNDAENKKRYENVMELGSTFVDYAGRAEQPTLEGLLEEISLFTDIDKYDENAAAVSMLTMHAAKGLEFPYVFVCGMEEGLFPSMRSMESESEVEEERRLCYVAFTRAKKKLYISCAAMRTIYGQSKYAEPSRFIGEIPEEFLNSIRKQPQKQSFAGGWDFNPFYTKDESKQMYKPNNNKSVSNAQSSIISQAVSAPKTVCIFNVGERVNHKAFGDGTVISATAMGGDTLLEVNFDSIGTKRLMANSAANFMKKEQ